MMPNVALLLVALGSMGSLVRSEVPPYDADDRALEESLTLATPGHELAALLPEGARVIADWIGIDTRDTATFYGSAPVPKNKDELEYILKESLRSRKNQELSLHANEEDCGSQQAFFLDFPEDTFYRVRFEYLDGTVEDRKFARTVQYSDKDKEEIKDRLEGYYKGFNVAFYLEKPDMPEECISKIRFACDYTALGQDQRPCLTIVQQEPSTANLFALGASLFGLAQRIDFLNQNRGDSAFVASEYWEFLEKVFYGTDGYVASATGLEPATALKRATQNLAYTTAAHEAGHNSGLRHFDSLALSAKFDTFAFNFLPPGVIAMNTNFAGTETTIRMMASPVQGQSLEEVASGDLFFSERSAIKLALAYGLEKGEGSKGALGRVIKSEEEASKAVIIPTDLILPNPVMQGTFAGGEKLQVRAAVLQGSLSIPPGTEFPVPLDSVVGSDTYRFRFKEGDFVTAESISYVTGGALNTDVRVTRPSTGEVLCTSLQEFESFDGVCFDVAIPANDVYEVEIMTYDVVCVLQQCETLSSLECIGSVPINATAGVPNCPAFFEGKYNFLVYTTNKALGKPTGTAREDRACTSITSKKQCKRSVGCDWDTTGDVGVCADATAETCPGILDQEQCTKAPFCNWDGDICVDSAKRGFRSIGAVKKATAKERPNCGRATTSSVWASVLALVFMAWSQK